MNNQEYELDLVDLGKTILKRWKLLALVTVIVAAVSGALMASRPEYRYSALIAVNVRSVSNSISNENSDSDTNTNTNTSVNVDTDASGESALLGSNFQVQKDETSDSASKTATKSKRETASESFPLHLICFISSEVCFHHLLPGLVRDGDIGFQGIVPHLSTSTAYLYRLYDHLLLPYP